MRAFVAAALICLAGPCLAQPYPSKAVRVVVSFPAGSSTDIVARVVLHRVSADWGQPAVVENRAGAGGTIGASIVAHAPADGYTLLVNSSAHAINPAIRARLPFDTERDFVEVVPLAIQPNVLVVNAGAPWKTLRELVAAARAKPGSIDWGHAGVGSGTHLNTEKFIAAAGIQVTQIPFKGTPEVLQAMFSESVDCYWIPISAGIAHVKSGKLRALAVSTPTRSATLPDVPTTGEAGVSGADAPIWFGIWGPAGTPAAIVSKINADVRKALGDATVRQRLANGGAEPLDMSAEEFAQFVRSEIEDYRRAVRAAGIKPQ